MSANSSDAIEFTVLDLDCGFANFADNPFASSEVAERKLAAIIAAAKALRIQYGSR